MRYKLSKKSPLVKKCEAYKGLLELDKKYGCSNEESLEKIKTEISNITGYGKDSVENYIDLINRYMETSNEIRTQTIKTAIGVVTFSIFAFYTINCGLDVLKYNFDIFQNDIVLGPKSEYLNSAECTFAVAALIGTITGIVTATKNFYELLSKGIPVKLHRKDLIEDFEREQEKVKKK